MALPKSINFDFLIRRVLSDLAIALDAWVAGQPRSEEALMNHLTGQLSRRRRGCDVGRANPINARIHLALLHRKGRRQTDKYGADLAVTVYIDQENFLKTAFFQLKKAKDYQTCVETRQLVAAQSDSRVFDRSFVLAIDEDTLGCHIKDASSLLRKNGGNTSRNYDIHNWLVLTPWLWDWLSCRVGTESKLGDPRSVEALLEQFVDKKKWSSPWSISEPEDIGDDVIPAKSWVIYFLNRSESTS